MKNRIVALLFAFVIALSFCSCNEKSIEKEKISNIPQEEEKVEKKEEAEKLPSITIVEPSKTATLHTDLQDRYIDDNYNTIKNYVDGKSEFSTPKAVKFQWKKQECDGYELTLSEYENLENGITYKTVKDNYSVNNLKINVKYYWRVAAVKDGEYVAQSKVETVTVKEKCIRNISVDGVTNFRDLGGYTTKDGKTVKQGLYYRCGKLNSISVVGKVTFLDELGIKSDIDLRYHEKEISGSPASDKINYLFFGMQCDDGIMEEYNYDCIGGVFNELGDEKNYPVAVHCAIGTDRTGLICFLSEAILGMNEEDMYRDYLFSCFGTIGGTRSASTIENYIKKLAKYDGDTLSERAESFVISCGASEKNIENFKRIMLG